VLYFQQVPAVQNGFILLWNLWWHAAEDAFGQSPSEFILCYISYKWMHYFWTAILSPNLRFHGRLLLEQTLNSSLPYEQVGLKFCLAWASLSLLFLRKLANDLPWPLSIRQVRMKSYLPSRKVYMSLTTGWLNLPSSISLLLWLSAIFPVKLEEGRPLPSPSHLKRRIIIKNKKLKPEQECEGEKKK